MSEPPTEEPIKEIPEQEKSKQNSRAKWRVVMVLLIISTVITFLFQTSPFLPSLFAILAVVFQFPAVQKSVEEIVQWLDARFDVLFLWVRRCIQSIQGVFQRLRAKVKLPWIIAIVSLCLLVTFQLNALWLQIVAQSHPPTATKLIPPYTSIAADEQLIGISDGSSAFDIQRADGRLKQEAADATKLKDSTRAKAFWELASIEEENDAEPLIYQEDQAILDSGSQYVTFIVAVTLTGKDLNAIQTGQDILQGTYLAQKEFDNTHLLKIYLLIASVGDPGMDAPAVASQIILYAHTNPIAGVIGWPFGADDAIKLLNKAHIITISPVVYENSLKDVSYFFSVSPSIDDETSAAISYAEHTLHATNAAVFYDTSDPYSVSLANSFSSGFTADGNAIVPGTQTYTRGDASTLKGLLHDVLSAEPNLQLIYLAGYPDDAQTLLENLRQYPNVHVMGGDALYQLVQSLTASDCTIQCFSDFNGLYFTTFAHPDMWKALHQNRSPFFEEYAKTFNRNNEHPANIYGYTQADSTVTLAYDAVLVLSKASSNALEKGEEALTSKAMYDAMYAIKGSNAVEGASGTISFAEDGSVNQRAIVVLYVSEQDIALKMLSFVSHSP